jgi:DNA polymerase III subunit epsilon
VVSVSTQDQRVPLLRGADFVVVDLETTGWLSDTAGITEIGAVRLRAGAPVAEFSALVNPGVPIPPEVAALTGITDAMVCGAPPIEQVLPEFLDFADGSVIAAHNAPFDIGFLDAACRQCGTQWPSFAVIDTAMLARLVLGPDDVPDHKLATLSGHFTTATAPCHRALADARATAGVLLGLLGRLADAAASAEGGRRVPLAGTAAAAGKRAAAHGQAGRLRRMRGIRRRAARRAIRWRPSLRTRTKEA